MTTVVAATTMPQSVVLTETRFEITTGSVFSSSREMNRRVNR